MRSQSHPFNGKQGILPSDYMSFIYKALVSTGMHVPLLLDTIRKARLARFSVVVCPSYNFGLGFDFKVVQ